MIEVTKLISIFDTQFNAERLHHAWILENISNDELKPFLDHCLLKLLNISAANVEAHPAIFQINTPDKISVEEIRKASSFLEKTAWGGTWRVLIIFNSETMTQQAQNALLKMLEEPPASTFILLHSSKSNHLLETIYSRGFVLQFGDEFVTHELYAQFEALWQNAFSHLHTRKDASLLLELQQWCATNAIDSKTQGIWVLKALKSLINQDIAADTLLEAWAKGSQYVLDVERGQLESSFMCAKTTSALLQRA